MNDLIIWSKKHTIALHIILAVLLFISFFLPYYSRRIEGYSYQGKVSDDYYYALFDTWRNYIPTVIYRNDSLKHILKVIFFECGFSFIPVLILSVCSCFSNKNKVFNIVEKIFAAYFLVFFIRISCYLIEINNRLHDITPHISFYLWAFLFICDCIYIFIALRKAFPKTVSK